DDLGMPKFISRTWALAAIRASRELRNAVRTLLERASHVRTPDKLIKLAELAIELELWEELGHLFDAAVRALLDEGRQHDMMVFVYRTYNATPDEVDVATPHLWRAIAKILAYTDGARSLVQPTRLAGQPPSSIPLEIRATLHAYFLADAGRKPEAREVLANEVGLLGKRSRRRTDEPFVPPSISWIAAYTKARILSDLPRSIYPELVTQLQEWLAHPRFADPADQFDLRYIIISRLADHLALQKYLEILRPMEELTGDLPWKEARFRLLRAAHLF